jgi:hypothetical protein
MSNDSLLMKRVEYQTSRCDFFEGLVVEHDEEAGMVVVVDTDDGTRWRGSEAHVLVLED